MYLSAYSLNIVIDYCLTSMAQPFILLALEEEVLGSISCGTNLKMNFLKLVLIWVLSEVSQITVLW